MGSRLKGWADAQMFSTDAHIHFQLAMQDQATTAQAAGIMQTMSALQLNKQLAAGHGGAGGGASTSWSGLPWFGIGSTIVAMSAWSLLAGLIAIAMVYATKGDEMAMMIASVVAVFPKLFRVMWMTKMAQAGIMSGTNFLASLGFATILGALVAYLVYGPHLRKVNGGGGDADAAALQAVLDKLKDQQSSAF